MFQSVDRHQSGIISIDSLQEVLCSAIETDLRSDTLIWNTILDVVDPVGFLQYLRVLHLQMFKLPCGVIVQINVK